MTNSLAASLFLDSAETKNALTPTNGCAGWSPIAGMGSTANSTPAFCASSTFQGPVRKYAAWPLKNCSLAMSPVMLGLNMPVPSGPCSASLAAKASPSGPPMASELTS